jgi:hypothetical protein
MTQKQDNKKVNKRRRQKQEKEKTRPQGKPSARSHIAKVRQKLLGSHRIVLALG